MNQYGIDNLCSNAKNTRKDHQPTKPSINGWESQDFVVFSVCKRKYKAVPQSHYHYHSSLRPQNCMCSPAWEHFHRCSVHWVRLIKSQAVLFLGRWNLLPSQIQERGTNAAAKTLGGTPSFSKRWAAPSCFTFSLHSCWAPPLSPSHLFHRDQEAPVIFMQGRAQTGRQMPSNSCNSLGYLLLSASPDSVFLSSRPKTKNRVWSRTPEPAGQVTRGKCRRAGSRQISRLVPHLFFFSRTSPCSWLSPHLFPLPFLLSMLFLWHGYVYISHWSQAPPLQTESSHEESPSLLLETFVTCSLPVLSSSKSSLCKKQQLNPSWVKVFAWACKWLDFLEGIWTLSFQFTQVSEVFQYGILLSFLHAYLVA